MTCREWLAQNGYDDVAALIDEAIRRIEAKGKKSRRNWWDTLAGGPGGRPSVREGLEFPVLRVAQIRKGVPVTANAVSRSAAEQPPDVRVSGRWPAKKSRRRLPQRTDRVAKKVARKVARHARAS